MNILMVCLGNICRSPLAEGIMQQHLKSSGIQGHVDSAGVLSFHEGDPPQPGSIRVASNHGLDISQQKSRPFVVDDFERFDLIFTMDRSVHEQISSKAKNPEYISKTHLLLDFAGNTELHDVPDPYRLSDEAFEHVYQLIDEACREIVSKLKPKEFNG
ncbi:MAG: low molecular weight protein-tyrosine-phosphatase [Arcticibacter sp.]|jgi:protein-tyrosine phosphatase